ncbi:hypothetical protein [Hydrogenimonas urashimensis]|uniref:hypothetical protein n=1 Tax=Hydrogenimonas urashimensis TaxID=2740515 RepID=UPI0019167BE2|nr:hypothetical protein [Hydrogenimonas urashimensis]
MKYLISLLVIILLLVGALYGVLFTSPGNNLLKPVIEKKIAAQVPLPTTLETFVLRPDRFEIALKIGEDTRIEAKGTMNLMAQSVDATYLVDIKELANLQKLIGQKLNGPFKTNGTIKGDQKMMHIDGVSDVAGSATDYHLALRNFSPENLKAKIAHLHIDRLLHMVNQPQYAEGEVDIEADIPSLNMKNLKGNVVTTIAKGLVHPAPVKSDFNLSIPANLTFKGNIHTRLTGTKAISNVDFVTSIASLKSKAVTYDISDGSLATDYHLHVPNLDDLYFVTNQHMKGKITVTGDVKVAKNGLEATAHSDTLGGAFDAIVKNNKVNVKIKNIQTVALTDMLLYPHIFDSRANMNLDYDTVTQQGVMHAELLNGQILPNKMSFMLRQMANFDITREVYERTTLDTKIDRKVLHSDLYMKSKLTEISSKNGLVDLDKQYIDTTINVKLKKMFIPVVLKGKLSNPEVKIDSKGLIKAKAKEELEKRLPDNIKKSPAGGLLKKLF